MKKPVRDEQMSRMFPSYRLAMEAINNAANYLAQARKLMTNDAESLEQRSTKKCCGHRNSRRPRKGEYKCCPRAGQYNGFRSPNHLFTCPNGCSCHD